MSGKYDTSSIGLWYSPSKWNTIGIIHRQCILWSDHLKFFLMLVFSVDCDSAWSKVSEMVWFICLIARVSRDHYTISKMFFLKNTKLVASGKITWFWSTLKKVPRINYDVTKRYRVLKFFKLKEQKKCTAKVKGLFIQQIFTTFLEFILSKRLFP